MFKPVPTPQPFKVKQLARSHDYVDSQNMKNSCSENGCDLQFMIISFANVEYDEICNTNVMLKEPSGGLGCWI